MGLFAMISHKIGDNLVRSNVIKEEDAEIYIYGINQIFVSVLNVSSALIIGWVFGAVLEITVFMAAYIPLRTFAGGYHAKTPTRCYILSLIIIIIVLVKIKYFHFFDIIYYIVLTAEVLIILLLSPVEDKNKLLNVTEQKVYKRRVAFITLAELVIILLFKVIGLDNLFTVMIYSFVVVGCMLIAGKIKLAIQNNHS
ncbi:MAG: accessory gene regulator B family protein [Ruminiclostridium sp.]|nr:accessory gene regulator B family protein [Ruminiclostridium sp.]